MASGGYMAGVGVGVGVGVGKRKEYEEVVDVLSDFSLSFSSPPLKIRRLDAGLPPIMEEEIPPHSMMFEQKQLPREQIDGPVGMSGVQDMGDSVPLPLGEDRAIVLYKPVDASTPFSSLPSNASILVSSELIRGLKSQIFNQGNQRNLEDNSLEGNNLALVPWVPPSTMTMSNLSVSELESQELGMPMETEETGVASMEVEEETGETTSGDGLTADSLHQWQQQHCMTLPAFPNPSAPVMWSR